MRVCIATVLAMMVLTGCASSSPPAEQALAAPKRELMEPEKRALAPIFAASLKDPNAAQFKWMPVILTERNGITDYCGLVNGKNSYGGYTGFVRFYAQLRKDNKSQFTQGTVREIEPPNREPNFIDPRWLNGICEQFGYENFAIAK